MQFKTKKNSRKKKGEAKFIKLTKFVISRELISTRGICMEKNCFLNSLKITEVISIYKGGDKKSV